MAHNKIERRMVIAYPVDIGRPLQRGEKRREEIDGRRC